MSHWAPHPFDETQGCFGGPVDGGDFPKSGEPNYLQTDEMNFSMCKTFPSRTDAKRLEVNVFALQMYL